MELQVGVKILVKNAEGKFLLLRRSQDIYKAVENPWDIPGGRIDPGSSLLENLAREVGEETGMKLIGTPRIVAAQDIFVKDKDRHVVRITYVGAAEGIVRLSEEHTAYEWCTLEEMAAKEYLDKYVRELLESGLVS